MQVILSRGQRLVSCSKDGLLRVWDLETQHCCQTLAAGKGEVWSLDVDPLETRLVAGAWGLLHVWGGGWGVTWCVGWGEWGVCARASYGLDAAPAVGWLDGRVFLTTTAEGMTSRHASTLC